MTDTDTARPLHLDQRTGRQMRLIADLVTIKATTTQTGGAFVLIESWTPSGGGLPLHTQRFDDATYLILDGTYRFQIGNESLDLGPGGCAFVPRDTPHAVANRGQAAARLLVIASPGGVWERFIDEVGDPVGRAPWAIDMARLLAVAPKYGITFAETHAGDRAGGAPR